MYRTRFALAVTAVALLVAACGDSSSAEQNPAPPSTEAAATSTTAAPAPTTTAAPTATEAPSAFPVTIAASNGDIELEAMPTRIVSMSATHTEMLYAIGAGDQVVAVDAFSNYPADAPVTDLTGFAPNVEAIVGFETDLVVTDGDWDGTSMGALTELGIPVLILPAAQSFDDVYAQIEQLGAATGHIANAAELVANMQADVTAVLESLPDTEEGVTFYHELDNTFYSVTSETFIGQVYASMGLVNIADEVGEGSFGYPQLAEEYILEQDPDLILLADTICCGMSTETLAERPGWEALTAVGRGSVVELNDDVASRWGPRVVELMQAVADAIIELEVDA
ncbi:MAG: ABC transporter substrate-binding protein [Acidimicrobiia bacterium]|nr:ABC transporter substrate-binding protein [Acidimicrobiia bacterium]